LQFIQWNIQLITCVTELFI